MGVLLPQVCGGSVGLAAGLIGLIAAGCAFVGRRCAMPGCASWGFGAETRAGYARR